MHTGGPEKFRALDTNGLVALEGIMDLLGRDGLGGFDGDDGGGGNPRIHKARIFGGRLLLTILH